MSLYFEYVTDLSERTKGSIGTQSWSQCESEHAIVAVATKNGDINLFLEEGDHLEPDATIHRAGIATHLAWHPKTNILAAGWDDGTVSIWTEKDRLIKDDSTTHKSPLSLLLFSPDGSRLISGDESGLLTVWQLDNRSRLTVMHQYNKRGSITHCVFRTAGFIGGGSNINNHSNDFSSPPPSLTCPPFFFGGSSGTIYFADDVGHCTEAVLLGQALHSLYYSPSKDYLAMITVDVVLHKHRISADGRMTQERKVKLSIKGDGSDLQTVFIGNGLLAAANSEPQIRVYHLEKDESYYLPLNNNIVPQQGKDVINCVAFNPRKRVLAGATAQGRVVLWKYIAHTRHSGDNKKDSNNNNNDSVQSSENDWEVLPPVESRDSILHIRWGPGEGLLSLATKDSVSILNETVLHAKIYDQLSLLQLSSESLLLNGTDGKSVRINTSIRIKGLDLNDKYLIVYNGKRAEIRELYKDGTIAANGIYSSFPSRATQSCLHNDTIYNSIGNKIEIWNLQGITKAVLPFTESEGLPSLLNINGDYLTAATSNGVIKLWDISRREPKSIVPGRLLEELKGGAGVIKAIKVNINGTKIAFLRNKILYDSSLQIPDTTLYVYDVELDKIFSFDFGPKFFPIVIEWDQKESKLLAVETKKVEGGNNSKKDDTTADKENNDEKNNSNNNNNNEQNSGEEGEDGDERKEEKFNDNDNAKTTDAEVTTLFATSDHGILMQDSFGIDSNFESLIGISVPYLLFMSRPLDGEDGGMVPRLKKRTMRDFIGMEKENEETKQNLLLFSYYLTIGNMDDAYRAVKKINSTSIWENMAQMCVKTKRLDVAEVCLGNMNNARGARAVREAKKEEEKDAQIAMLAIQLGMIDDAERLYKECGRYDLLVKLYIASNRWKDALTIASKYDRIHLKSTHYLYAKYLESFGDTAAAIQHYEKAEAHRYEVPRMLFDSHRLGELEDYIKASSDPLLFKWWAQYCESNQRYDEALRYYAEGKDTLALVRIYCYLHNEAMAKEICLQSNDPAACYHLGRQFENQGLQKEAIQLYTKAKRYNHGIRLAKENEMENELLALSLESASKELMIEAAKYFEEKGSYEKAVLLYEKGGKIPRALDLCFKAQLFDSLRQISDSLSSDTDPALLSKCGEFFLSHSQYEKAVHLFISAKEYLKALNLCMKNNVKITEQMAEKLTPAKGKSDKDKDDRNNLLKKLAHICKDQGSYHLACKKYTQAGDHERAMKCLLKSNDNEKIIYYAAMTKKPEVYKLAANYLQNLDWHNDAEIMKTIINFYTKAKAWSALSSFYDACAQVEIDEYRDYEKAYDALQLSMNYLLKSKTSKEKPENDKGPAAGKGKEDKLDTLQARINLVSKFVEARKLVKTDPDEMIKICNQLYEQPDVESAIRVGDVFALLIEYYYSIRKYPEAYTIIEKMRAANIILSPYLDQQMVQAIHKSVGAEMQPENIQENNQNGGGGMDDGGIAEELQEPIDD